MNVSVITSFVNNFKLFKFITDYSCSPNFIIQLSFANARILLKLISGRVHVIHYINDIKDSEIINNYDH